MKRFLLILHALCPAVFAQTITYNGFNFGSGQPVSTVREMAANGANDHALTVNLPEPGFPAWSRDGRLLALSSPEPGRPSKQSRDLFVMDGTTGAITKISRFEDYADGNTFRKYLPTAHAFSPDGRRLAATVYLNTSVVNSGITMTPQIYLFDTSGLEPPVLLVAANLSDGLNLEGFGCDWSSTNQIAWPGSCGSPSYYAGSFVTLVNGTAIYILQPNVNAPQARQLTFPVVRTEGGGSYYLKRAEVDYAPSFSPDGSKVAYVRVTRSAEPLQNTFPPDQCSIRVININGAGDHEILHLNAGLWISQMAWSPDGSQLLFDMGPQTIINNIPYAQPVAQTVEIHTINMNTLVPSRVHTAPAVWPSWRPASTPAVTVPQLSIQTAQGSNNIELTWPANAGSFQLLSNPNLSGTWSDVNTTPVVSGGVNKVTLPRNAPKMFFRLKTP